MGTRVRIGDGQHTYKDTSYLVGDVSKSRLDELANELANETILYVNNTTGVVKYKGERGEKNSVAKVLDYTPRPIDLDTGIIEDVINVNNDKVTSNYQYLHVNKKLIPFETSLEEPVELQTIFELYVDDELVVDITNAWLAGKDTTDPEFSPTPYTVLGPFEYKSVLNTTGENQVQYRYYIIQIKDNDRKIQNIIGMTFVPSIYYIYDNENTPNINYKSYGPFYFIDNFAALFDSYYLENFPLYIRTVHFDGIKSTFKFSSTMPKIDTNPEMVEYKTKNICSKYPIGSTNGEDFGLTFNHLYNKNYNANFDDTKLKFNSYSDAKDFFSENIVATPDLANLVNFGSSSVLNINVENLKIIKTSNNTFYIEHPKLPVKSPVFYVNYKYTTRYAVIPNITKIEGNVGVAETGLYGTVNDAGYSSYSYINQELAKSYFGDYPYPNNKFKRPFSLNGSFFIYSSELSTYSISQYFVVKNKTENNSFFKNYCFVKIYYNSDYIGGTLCLARSSNGNIYFNLYFYVIDDNHKNIKNLIPDYITIDGKQYDVTDNGKVYTDINYNVFLENIESYDIKAFFTGKTYDPDETDPLTRIYFDVDYFNNSLNKVTLSTYAVFSFLVDSKNENSVHNFKADITNVNITKADSTHPDLISYKDISSNYRIQLNLNEKKYIEEYNAQWDSYNAANRPKITIYFDSIECYYRIDKYIDNELVTANDIMSIESDKLVLSVPFEIGKTLVSVTPEHSINELTQFVFDISTGTYGNPVVIELRYTTDDTSENAKIWPLQTVEDYTYGWLVNGETIVERQTNASAGNIVFALSGWNTNEGTSSAYNEQSTIEQQPWFEHYWALKASAKYHSIGKDGEKIEGCPTYFEFENAKSGDIIQIFYYNKNNDEIAKSPIVNVI